MLTTTLGLRCFSSTSSRLPHWPLAAWLRRSGLAVRAVNCSKRWCVGLAAPATEVAAAPIQWDLNLHCSP